MHSTDGNFLYNLAEDPGELNELSAQEPEKLQDMIRRLERELNALGLPDLNAEISMDDIGGGMDKETCLSLLALGYVESCDEFE